MITAEKRPWVTESVLDQLFWIDAYVEKFADLVFGQCDIDLVKLTANELYASKGHLSPWRVATAEFEALDEKAEYLPGGQHWRILKEDRG